MDFWNFTEYLIIILCMFFVCLKAYKPEEVRDNTSETILSLDTSNLIKAICCIVIILHHYALRVNIPLIGTYFGLQSGNYALTIFMLMSGFGVVKSELKHNTTAKMFFHRRFIKLLIPFWIVNILTIIVYSLINPQKPVGVSLDDIRVWDNFWNFGTGQYTFLDYVMLFLGIKEVDGAYWFLEVILYSYLALLVTKSLFDLKKKKAYALSFYTILITLFGIFTYYQQLPAQYYRNLWPLVLGFYVAVYENKLILRLCNIKTIITTVFCINIYFIFYIKVVHDLSVKTFVGIDIVLFVTFILSYLLRKYAISKTSLLSKVAILSYLIYLWHIKFLNLEWYYMGGYYSVILVTICSIVMAWLCNWIATCIYNRFLNING